MAPFPLFPMMAISASLVSAMVVQMSVFVYAGFMVEYLNVVDNKDRAGYYAGALSAAYMLGRVCSSHAWGMIADRCGRRFVLVFGILSNVILSLVFGCSTSFTMAFVSRFLLGLLNGVMVVSRTIVPEVCGKEHETVGMGFVTSSWTIGGVLGPGIGGLLSEPATYHPRIFSESGIFGRNPYLLPNLVGVGLALVALPLVLVYIKETPSAASDNPTSAGRYDSNEGGGKGDLTEANHASAADAVSALALKPIGIQKPSWMQMEENTTSTTKKDLSGQDTEGSWGLTTDDGVTKPAESLLAQGHVRVLIFINGVFAFTYSGFDEVYPLWALSSAAKGGLDWSSPQIGQVFLFSGLMVMVFEIFLGVPYLTPWFGVNLSQKLASACEVPVYLLIPLLSQLNGGDRMPFILSIILFFTCYACVNSYLLCVNLTVNNAVGRARRAELNGISVTVESVTRAISPMVCSVLFAFSIDGDHVYPFDYHFVFYLLASVRLVAACTGWNRITDNGNME